MIVKALIVLFIWWLLSQVIAWMLKPANDDEAVEVSAAVFLLPVAIALVIVDVASRRYFRWLARLFFGFFG